MKTTTILNNIESVKEYLNSIDNNELVHLHNIYCSENNSGDDEDFFNTYFDGKVMNAVRAISYGEYNYSDEYVRFNGYANLETFNSPSDHVDIDTLAQAIIDNPNDYDIELEEEEPEYKITDKTTGTTEELTDLSDYLTMENEEETVSYWIDLEPEISETWENETLIIERIK